MPRYHFNVRVGQRLEPDRTGLVLADAYRAYLEACAAIPGVGHDLLAAGRDLEQCRFEIADEEGRLLFEVSFSELVRDAGALRARHERLGHKTR